MRDIVSLWISPYRYSVEFLPEVLGPQNEKRLGQVDLVRLAIEVDATAPKQRQREILLHESIHAIDCSYDIGLSEEQVTRVSNGVADLLLQNQCLTRLFVCGDDA